MPCWLERTALVASAAVCRIVISSVTSFLLFCPASRGAPEGEWDLLARPRGAYCGEPRNFALSFCFLGGPQTRRAAKPAVPSARRRFPSSPCPREASRKGKEAGNNWPNSGKGRSAAPLPARGGETGGNVQYWQAGFWSGLRWHSGACRAADCISALQGRHWSRQS